MKKAEILLIVSFIVSLLLILNFKEIKDNSLAYYLQGKITFPFTFAQSVLNILKVNSLPIQEISISADKDKQFYSGTTNYTKQDSQTISTWLTAQQESDSYAFNCWQGCDYVKGNECSVYVNNGITQEVTAYYIPTRTIIYRYNTLVVDSWPIQYVSIFSTDPQFSGTTTYSKQSNSDISTELTAPDKVTRDNIDYYFWYWWGCDAKNNNKCDVSVSNGGSKTVTVYYSTSSQSQQPPPPEEQPKPSEQPEQKKYNLSVDSLDIRTFICKNNEFNQSLWTDVYSKQSYPYSPSTTYAAQFYNDVASSTCPESQVNRPVEFSAKASCKEGDCQPATLQIKIEPESYVNFNGHYESTTTEIKYPGGKTGSGISLTFTYTFQNAYDYKVTACVVDKEGNNNCSKEQTLRIFDYICYYGFSAQTQRDWNNPPLYLKILKIFGNTDSPTRYWRNVICRARSGF